MADMLTPAQNAALEAVLPLVNAFIEPLAPPPPVIQPPASTYCPISAVKTPPLPSHERYRAKARVQEVTGAVGAVTLNPTIVISGERISPAVTFIHDHAGVITPLETALSNCLLNHEEDIRSHLEGCVPYDGHRSALHDLLAYRKIRSMKGQRDFEFWGGSEQADFTIDAETGVCWIGYTQLLLGFDVLGELHRALAAGEVVADDDGHVEGLSGKGSEIVIQDLWDKMVLKESRFAVLSNGLQLIIFERTATNVLSMSGIIGNAPSTVGNIIVGEFSVMIALTTLELSSYRLAGQGHPSDPPLSSTLPSRPVASPNLWPIGPVSITAEIGEHDRFLSAFEKSPLLFSKSVLAIQDATSPLGTPHTVSTLLASGLPEQSIHFTELIGKGSIWDVYTAEVVVSSTGGWPTSVIAKICRPGRFPELKDGSGVLNKSGAESSIAVELRAYTGELQAIEPGVVPMFYGCYSTEVDGEEVYMMIMEDVGRTVMEVDVESMCKRKQYHIIYQYEKLHEARIIHNDVHPRNWCFSLDDMADFRIIDFGQCVSLADKNQDGKVVDLEQLARQEMSYVRGWLSKTLRSWEFEKKKNMVWERPREGKWQGSLSSAGLDPERWAGVKIPTGSERFGSFSGVGSGWGLPY